MKTLQRIIIISVSASTLILSGCGRHNSQGLSNIDSHPSKSNFLSEPFDPRAYDPFDGIYGFSRNEWPVDSLNNEPPPPSFEEQQKAMQKMFEDFDKISIEAEKKSQDFRKALEQDILNKKAGINFKLDPLQQLKLDYPKIDTRVNFNRLNIPTLNSNNSRINMPIFDKPLNRVGIQDLKPTNPYVKLPKIVEPIKLNSFSKPVNKIYTNNGSILIPSTPPSFHYPAIKPVPRFDFK
ncbi:MAG: hypothetical protein V3U87_02045 [Methylococcaceae bacterium]